MTDIDKHQEKNKVTNFPKKKKGQADIVYLTPRQQAERARENEKKRYRNFRLLSTAAVLILLFAVSFYFLKDTNLFRKNTGSSELSEPVVTPLSVHFIDVGQGDAILAICGEECMLVDAGDKDHAETVVEYLREQGVERLKFVIGTHYDADHIGGMKKVLQNFPCDTVILPNQERDTKTYEKLQEEIASQGYDINYPVAGQKYNLGDSSGFMILGPQDHEYERNNDYSIVLRLTCGRNSFLLTGDAESVAEEELMNSGFELSSDVFKVAHHGSSSSTSEAFLRAVHPSIAIISVGTGNDSGHPHKAVLDLLNKLGIKIYRTDKKGTIVCVADGRSIKVK